MANVKFNTSQLIRPLLPLQHDKTCYKTSRGSRSKKGNEIAYITRQQQHYNILYSTKSRCKAFENSITVQGQKNLMTCENFRSLNVLFIHSNII